ncbi:SGNH/GDSL hydrolase family protein [Streptomyces sp. AN-3]|uniref:SGNH/GDSL hydrolase family protein n=1 Tax=Streptomyces sp. AN-3 TaxID=3044177 RepID=UPI00249AD876|nr:SGNH/GDSL hydrolase family protein [Streptomyces sp. AN-3]MDI3101943.1 SGNH/GDSL hydrolase family protein [Streptomyces sp. AN-3]
MPLIAALTLSLAAGIATTEAFAQTPPPGAAQGWSGSQGQSGKKATESRPYSIPSEKRSTVLGSDFGSSSDRAFTTSGDGTAFHLLVADEKMGYEWKTAASLAEPGFETDTWIGNACVTGSGNYAAVAYAPRTFTNEPELLTRGAFTAVVDLRSGKITKLPLQATLGYFSPGCGTGDDAIFTALTDDASEKNQTRLQTVDAKTGRLKQKQTVAGQVTSAIPTRQGIVAASGHHIVTVEDDAVKAVADTKAWPFQLKADAEGGVTFIDRVRESGKARVATDDAATVARIGAAALSGKRPGTKPAVLAHGKLTEFDLAATPAGHVYVTGSAKSTSAAAKAPLHNPGGLSKDARMSSHGKAAVTVAWADGKDSRISAAEALEARTARTAIHVVDTGKSVVLDAPPLRNRLGGVPAIRKGATPSPVLQSASGTRTAKSRRSAAAAASGTVEADRACSVPRNDPKKQAFQPTPRQVEWAVDQAVVGQLNKSASRPGNWKNTGMAGYAPQTLFPLLALSGGQGEEDWHVPAQVMLGITAQESNMWQASRVVVPGATGNSLIGNFYGVEYSPDGEQPDPFMINWADADCGYGITQVTDGMRMHGKERPGEEPKTTTQQEAIALDYAANIAAGVNILIEKWNQTRVDGMIINDGHPKYIENWFYALWAYNSGYYPKSSPKSGKWGVGWTNNPANPLWKENRTPFLEKANGADDYSHAATPQYWPYEEKVIGWAARPISAMFAPGDFQPGYRAAWWNSTGSRTAAKPPIDLFCSSSNDCNPSAISTGASNDDGNGPCLLPGDPHEDDPLYLKCWFNEPVTWKNCTLLAQCGNPVHRFNDTYPEQPDANSYPPRCNTGLPSGSLIVDDIPASVVPAGSSARNCNRVSNGTFDFTFGTDNARVDLHQIGAGNGNHFWFAHTRSATSAYGERMAVTGKWTLSSTKRGWMRVFAHIPDHGAHTRQAAYLVGGTNSTSPKRVHPQRIRENTWADLGVFYFTGTPTVTLATHTEDGTGDEDIAWDSVAFTPLPGKPKDFVVGMGDSYSSGEGASDGNKDYYPETNYLNEQNPSSRNACHRSTKAWSRQATIPGRSASIGERADGLDPSLDYHLIACSGARTYNVLHGGVVQDNGGELPQIEKGYLDQNTSLVTISIGGNDARFADVIQKCLIALGDGSCASKTFESGDTDSHVGGRDTKYVGKPLSEAIPGIINTIVRADISETLKQINAKAPNAKIVLMGYPPLFSDKANCLRLQPGISLGLSEASTEWLNGIAGTLAEAMEGAIDDAGAAGNKAWFSNPADDFAGKAVCGDPETVHGLVKTLVDSDDPVTDWPILKNYGLSAQSFHPKIAGARLYANSMEGTMLLMDL